MINFRKKLEEGTQTKKTNPIEIYDTLDRQSITGPLRPTQERILNEWYGTRKEDKDLIIKLHTGEGKTLIGLLILQSRINSNLGPCLYVCPNQYLVQQVCNEAKKFGIKYCTFEDKNIPDDFSSGNKILITTAQKVFNGKSVFGIGNRHTKVNTIIMDDSHACIDVIKEAYSITLKRDKNEDLYTKFLNLFEESLIEQREGSFLDIKNGDFETLMLVPYWTWQERITESLEILAENKEDKQILFAWPLLRDSLQNYECYISGSKIEISPRYSDIAKFGTFATAQHRILMSATTQDDSFFIKGLDYEISAIINPLLDVNQKWSGEKMIIFPSEIHFELERSSIISKFAGMKKNSFGIVAIVPSTQKAQQYKNYGAIVTNSDNIFEEIEKRKKGVIENTLVINNRYDGIDLPDEVCRILIMDSMPYFDALSDRYEEECRPDSEIINKKLAQKVEQGLGRGVRGEKDYCALLIIGSDLVKFMKNSDTRKYFSVQTRKQIEIGTEIVEMAKEEEMSEETPRLTPVIQLLKQSLERDEDWKAYYSSEMNKLSSDNDSTTIYERLKQEKDIERLYSQGDYRKAFNAMQKFIDNLGSHVDDLERGWYVQQLARYNYHIDLSKSIQLQKSAFKLNSYLLKPKDGIEFKKVSYINENRLNLIKQYFAQSRNFEELQRSTNAILDNLSFGVKSEKFEQALFEVGNLLGFISERPDQRYGKGPDNLWCVGRDQYVIFECKNEVNDNRPEISKKEAGQFHNHFFWFEENYGTVVTVKRFIIIPTKTISSEASITYDIGIIRKNKLKKFKHSIKMFINQFASYQLSEITSETIQEYLELHKLEYKDITTEYSEEYFQKQKQI